MDVTWDILKHILHMCKQFLGLPLSTHFILFKLYGKTKQNFVVNTSVSHLQ